MAAENIELRRELIRRLEAYGYAGTNMAPVAGDAASPVRDTMREMGGSAVGAAISQADAAGVKS